MSKILLIQPPQWYPVSPYLAVPLLAGQLKAAGFEVRACDLNIKFYNYLLTKERTAFCDSFARSFLKDNEVLYKDTDIACMEKSADEQEKNRYLKYITIKKFYEQFSAETDYIVNNIEWAVSAIKNKEEFFIPEKLSEAKHIIKVALRLVSLPYAPNEIDFDNYYSNPLYNLDWVNVKKQVNDLGVNMFYDYFDGFSDEISKEDYDIISLSMTDLSQMISVFTLSKMLKEKTTAKIIIGGNYSTQIYDEIMKHKDIFTDYTDYLMIGDGEIAITQLCRYLNEKCPLTDVPNLVCLDDAGKVISTGLNCKRIEMNKLAYADFSHYDMSLYFTPDPTFPIQLSKGCYWGKCNFCDYPFGQQGYNPKHIDRIIDEIKYYISTYNASKFMFVDEAIPPKFYNMLALAIMKEGLDINFYSFARLETDYTPEVLSNLYKAGARLFLWGYECTSPRIMKLMNKGIDVDKRMEILTDARKAGIWNNGLFMFGYPTEILEETKETMRFIKENRDIVPSCTLSNFSLKKNSRLKESIGENGVRGYTSGGEFYIVYKDIIDGISQSDRRELRRSFQFDFLNENANSMWPVVFSDFDHLLLYLSEYGCDYVSSYRSEKRICPEFR